MDRERIMAGEQTYVCVLDEGRRALEERLFGGEFAANVLQRGHLTLEELGEVASWKWNGAGVRVRAGNTPAMVERFTSAAIAHHDDARLATWILTYLYGVHVRMASAVLATLFPEEHTVLDRRVWGALAALGWAPDLEHVFGDRVPADFLDRCATYDVYRLVCAQKAAEFGVSLRALDRFLYMHADADAANGGA